MDEKIIHFDAKGQKLIKTRGEHRFASGTVGYIIAEFGLDDQWENMDVIDAVWQNTKYKVAVTLVRSDGLWTCPVPHEMAQLVAEVRVNLVGKVFVNGDLVQRLTTYLEPAFVVNELANISGTTETVIPQTQFDRFVGMVNEDAAVALESRNTAVEKATEASASATQAAQSAEDALASKTSAQEAAQSALEYKNNAQQSAEASANSASEAEEWADKAEQSAGQSGYMFFHIDERGHLIYERTPNVEVDFFLDNGHLFVRAEA